MLQTCSGSTQTIYQEQWKAGSQLLWCLCPDDLLLASHCAWGWLALILHRQWLALILHTHCRRDSSPLSLLGHGEGDAAGVHAARKALSQQRRAEQEAARGTREQQTRDFVRSHSLGESVQSVQVRVAAVKLPHSVQFSAEFPRHVTQPAPCCFNLSQQTLSCATDLITYRL